MSLLVVGSVAFDAVETPFGKCEKMLGGSTSHVSLAASYFADVRIVGVVGGDFSDAEQQVFDRHGIDTSDLEYSPTARRSAGTVAMITTSIRRSYARHPAKRIRGFQAQAF